MMQALNSIQKPPERPAPGTPQLPLESFASAAAMRAWVLGGGDVTLLDEKGHTLLFYATGCATADDSKAFCDLELAQLLIQHGVPLNARSYGGGYTVLKTAVTPAGLRKDPGLQLQIVQLLLDNNADTSIADGI